MQDENEEVLEVNETNDEPGTDTEESEEVSQGETSDDTETNDDSITLSKSEFDKLQREAFAAKRLREKVSKTKEAVTSSESPQALDQELVERTFLAAQMQILDPDVQDEAMRLASKFGQSIAQAVKDPDIKQRLENLTKQKKAQQAVAQGTGGSVQKGRGVDYYAQEYKRTGKLPEDNALVSKILDKLAQK
jgi:hypothetical protein